MALAHGNSILPAMTSAIPAAVSPELLANAKVAVAKCSTYGREMEESLKKCFDLLGGIGSLVKGKTVTVKVNFTGNPYKTLFGKPPGETYLTHGATATALASILLAEGAKRVRFVECAYYRKPLDEVMGMVGWDVKPLLALGKVETENTRNLGEGKTYSELKVPNGGLLFSSFQLNHSYVDTDVFVSLAKLKNHQVAGVTLSMKNVFGITPCALYGDDAGNEDAVAARGAMHGRGGWGRPKPLPGAKGPLNDPGETVIPKIVVDLCTARPVHLTVIDGITSMSGGEGFWNPGIKPTTPGVLVAGLNPVSTDAVCTAIMGYPDPRAPKGTQKPFMRCENHILLGEQAGLGTADLSKIDVRGASIAEVRYPYDSKA